MATRAEECYLSRSTKKGKFSSWSMWTAETLARLSCVNFQWNVGLFGIDAARKPEMLREMSG